MKHFQGFIWSQFALFMALIAPGMPAALADAPGAPGLAHRWAPALKQAVGTAYEIHGARSPVWFTVAQGILTEVFYPHVDQPQIGDYQFIITDGHSFFSEQKKDTHSQVRYSDNGQTVLIDGDDNRGRYQFHQEIITDPEAPVVRIKTTITWIDQPMKVFVLFKPAINNSGAGNLAYAGPDSLLAGRANSTPQHSERKMGSVAAAIVPKTPFTHSSAGYVGTSDGWQDLSKHFNLTANYPEAGPGNVALTGEVPVGTEKNFTFEVALAFGPNGGGALNSAQFSLNRPFDQVKTEYDRGWNSYLSRLTRISKIKISAHTRKLAAKYSTKLATKTSTLSRRSAIVIKTHEDKLERGAIVASLSKPGIPDGDTAPDKIGGYHLVWPRDLYHAAMGLLAAGDTQTPVDVLGFLKNVQNEDGSWSQNFWIDGTPYWTSLQLDEVAFPILLTHQLAKRGIHHADPGEIEMIRRAALFIQSHGPVSPEDRWEELGGFIPSTLAAEIAGLKAASQITGDQSFTQTANNWIQNLSRWTLVQSGPHGSNYFLRASPGGNPNGQEPIEIANSGGTALANEILDGGFLDLVRFKVLDPQNHDILSTLSVYEKPSLGIAGGFNKNGGGLHYRRYNRDAYGYAHTGGYWPLLAGERGHYALAAGDNQRAINQLAVLENSALSSGLIPEQIIDPISGGRAALGVACPLVWAHAEQIRLERSIEDGVVFDSP